MIFSSEPNEFYITNLVYNPKLYDRFIITIKTRDENRFNNIKFKIYIKQLGE